MAFPAKTPPARPLPSPWIWIKPGGHMIWIVVVAMATVGFWWMKVRRNRKAGAR